jgi:hypothetical protein
MQPNPGDTTNALLLYQIQMTANGPNSVPDLSTLSSSTGFPSSMVWVQTLAYASLAFSVLAAFGAVLGKQWLHSYTTNRGRGTLEERGIERQMKLDGAEYFRLQAILQAFLVLLQISLLLFGLSLSANMWVKQTTISSVIVCTTAFGIIFYAGTILMSALRPDSPFQVPGPGLFTAICKRMLPKTFTFTPDTLTSNTSVRMSAIRWIQETSTNPEVVDTVAGIISCVQCPPNLDVSAIFAHLRDRFLACRDNEELYIKYGKAMAHLCIQPVKIDEKLLEFYGNDKFLSTRSRFIRDAFMAGRAAYDQLKNTREADDRRKHWASVRTALRTMIVHARWGRLSRPDEEYILGSDLRWHDSNEHEPSCEEFDWLVDYLADGAFDWSLDHEGLNDMHHTDDETKGNAFLALSAMRGLGSSTKQRSYIESLIRCMGSTRPSRLRYTALQAAHEAREGLASITSASMPQDVDTDLMNKLSCAILTAVCPNDDQTMQDTGPDASFYHHRDWCYTRLIGALSQNDEWFQRLTRDRHVDRCISLVDTCPFGNPDFTLNHLVTLLRIKSSGKDLPFGPTQERWRLWIADAWTYADSLHFDDDDVDLLIALVTATRLNLTASADGIPREWLAGLAEELDKILEKGRQPFNQYDIAEAKIDAALSSLLGLHTELSHVAKQRKTSQKDTSTGASGLDSEP